MGAKIHARFLPIAAELGPALHSAIKTGGPLPEHNPPDAPLARYLCRVVVGQQLSVKAARSIWNRVESACRNAPLEDAFCLSRVEDLRDCGLSGGKVKALIAIADALKGGALDEGELRKLDASARAARLVDIWGVGRWTADMANMFWFAEPDIWPDGDLVARRTLEKLTSKRRKTIRTAARFAPHRTALALYMWRHVNAPPT